MSNAPHGEAGISAQSEPMDRITEACRRMELTPSMENQYRAVFDKCADWYRPTNSLSRNGGAQEYSISHALHEAGLLDVRMTCRWIDGRPHGKRVEFRQAKAIRCLGQASEQEEAA